MTAFLLVAGSGFAQTGGLDAVGDVAGGAGGSYDVDASGAYDAAADTQSDAHSNLVSQWDDANSSYDDAKAQLQQQRATDVEPDVPEPDVPVDALNSVEASHDDRLEKAADVETGLVDAKADASAWGNVKAFFTGLADATGDAFGAITGLFDTEIAADDAADTVLDDAWNADNDARSELDAIIRSEPHAATDVEPRLSGDYAFSHAGQASSDAAGAIQLP